MKKIVRLSSLLALVVLSGCGVEVENDLSYERLSSESSIIAFCDSDDDSLVSVSELEACQDLAGYQELVNNLPVVPVDNPEDSDRDNDPEETGGVPFADLPKSGGADLEGEDFSDPENPPMPKQKGSDGPLTIELYDDWFNPQPLGDVVASTDGLLVMYDDESRAAEIQAEGEISYATTDGYNYIFVDGQWTKVNFTSMSGGVNMSLEGVDQLDPAVEVPTNIPVADMPYKASNMSYIWILSPRWEFTECVDGSECLEIQTVEGGILRYDRSERLVEAELDGMLVSFSHLDQEVFVPDAVEVNVPNFGGMSIPDIPEIPAGMGVPADFDMSQLNF